MCDAKCRKKHTWKDTGDPRCGVGKLPDADTGAKRVAKASINAQVIFVSPKIIRVKSVFRVTDEATMAKSKSRPANLLGLGDGSIDCLVIGVDGNTNIQLRHGDFETLVAEQVHSGRDVPRSRSTDEVRFQT